MLKSMKRFDTWLNEYRLETDKRTDSECRNGRLGPLTVAATLTRPFLRTETVKEGLGDLRSTVAGKLGGKRTGSDMEIQLQEGGGGGAGFTTAPP